MRRSHTRSSPRRGRHVDVSADPRWARWRSKVRRVVLAALDRQGVRAAQVSVAVVDDATIARLHERYLGIAGPTDVLSFDLRDASGEAVEGEVVVSAETATRESRRRGLPFEEELGRYAVHGVLHLLGHRDDRPAFARAMHAIEDAIVAGEPQRTARSTRRR